MNKKNLLLIFLSLTIITIHLKHIVALERNDINNSVCSIEEVSDQFKEIVRKVFDDNQSTDVIDMEGNSVKGTFISHNVQHYNEEDYLSIQTYFDYYSLRIVYPDNDKIQSRASVVYDNSELVFHSYVTPDYNYRIEFQVECYAVIRVNDATGVITSFFGPSISLTYFSPSGMAVRGNLDNVNTDYEWVSSAHRGMYFYYNYRAKLEMAENYGMKSTYYTPTYSKTIRSHY